MASITMEMVPRTLAVQSITDSTIDASEHAKSIQNWARSRKLEPWQIGLEDKRGGILCVLTERADFGFGLVELFFFLVLVVFCAVNALLIGV